MTEKINVVHFPKMSQAITEELFKKVPANESCCATIGHPEHSRAAIVLGLDLKSSADLCNALLDDFAEGKSGAYNMYRCIFMVIAKSFLKDAESSDELMERYGLMVGSLGYAYNSTLENINKQEKPSTKATH